MTEKLSASNRQAFFSTFSRQAVAALSKSELTGAQAHPPPIIMLTGGFRSASQMISALEQQHAQIIGVGRMSVVCPDLPRVLSSHRSSTGRGGPSVDLEAIELPALPNFPTPSWFPRLVGAGVNMTWYVAEIRRISSPHPRNGPFLSRGPLGSLWEMWFWFCDRGEVGRFVLAVLALLLCALFAAGWLLK